MTLPQVSIALATYNGASYIEEQLESLARQSWLPCELVVTDDRSSDATLEIVEHFARRAPFPVHIHRNETRLRFAENFFKAASLCRGELIAFCDQDDRWLPSKLQVCAEAFCDPEVWVCVHSSRLWYGGTKFGRCVPYFTKRRVLGAAVADPLTNYLGFSNVIRKRVLEVVDHRVRPRHPNVVRGVADVPHPMVHDQWIWFIGSIFGKVAFIPDVQVLYRQHETNTVGFTYRDKPVRERLELDRAARFAQAEEIALECALFIEQLAHRLPAYQARCLAAARTMRWRARTYRLRQAIYLPTSRFSARARAFAGIVRARGYRLETLGAPALLKDLLIGVPGTLRVRRKLP